MIRSLNTTYPRKHGVPADNTYTDADFTEKSKRIFNELRAVGISKYGLRRSESREIPKVIHDNESIKGAVYGYHEDGFAVLLATDLRVLFIDKKPLFVKADELTYDLVGGVTYGKVGPIATVNLHTRIGDYKFRTFNFKSAEKFIHFIEGRCLEHKLKRRGYYDD
jgi:hypothetical protein